VELIAFLRDERRFESVDALRAQMTADAERAKAVLGGADGGRAVLFDFDDTLQDRFAAITWTAERLLTRHLHGVDEKTRRVYAHEMAVANNGGYVNYDEYFEHFASKWPFDEDVTAASLQAEYRREMPYGSKLYDEAKDVLTALRNRGYRLGIVTNGWADMQHRKIDVSGIRPYVDLVTVSGEEDVKKPDAAIFKRTAARLGVAPENCIFVGDHPINDIEGALAAGMNAIYLNTRHLPCEADVPEAVNLDDVLKLL
jgi:putative hydrolase of the HAD superfamily